MLIRARNLGLKIETEGVRGLGGGGGWILEPRASLGDPCCAPCIHPATATSPLSPLPSPFTVRPSLTYSAGSSSLSFTTRSSLQLLHSPSPLPLILRHSSPAPRIPFTLYTTESNCFRSSTNDPMRFLISIHAVSSLTIMHRMQGPDFQP